MCFLILEREKGMVGWERERERERQREEREEHGWERETSIDDWLPPVRTPTGDRNRNPGICLTGDGTHSLWRVG